MISDDFDTHVEPPIDKSQRKKRTMCTSAVGSTRDDVINLETEARKEKHKEQMQFDKELHSKRLQEADFRIQIAQVELDMAKYRQAAEKRKLDMEEEALLKKLCKDSKE